MLEKIRKFLCHNYFLITAACICAVFLTWSGCESQIQSPRYPAKFINRAELQAEIDSYLAEVKIAATKLDQQDLIKQKILEFGLVVAEGGTLNPVGVIASLASICGVGAVLDNRRKDSLLKMQRSTAENNKSGTT